MHQRENSLHAYFKRQEEDTISVQQAWVSDAFYISMVAHREAFGGFTDDQLAERLEDLTGTKWVDSSVRSARGSLCACAGRRKDCAEAHESGQTHGGKEPWLYHAGNRESNAGNPMAVWMPTEAMKHALRGFYLAEAS